MPELSRVRSGRFRQRDGIDPTRERLTTAVAVTGVGTRCAYSYPNDRAVQQIGGAAQHWLSDMPVRA